jgi:hypothetical protein
LGVELADGAAHATDGRITAFDGDDCVELELMMMNTPRSFEDRIVGGGNTVLVESTAATFGSYRELVDYEEDWYGYSVTFPEGMMVAKQFCWLPPANAAAHRTLDNRPAMSRVCFLAHDKYLYTNDPLYCVDLIIKVRA